LWGLILQKRISILLGVLFILSCDSLENKIEASKCEVGDVLFGKHVKESDEESEVLFSDAGEYKAVISLGESGKKYAVVVDTGSADLVIGDQVQSITNSNEFVELPDNIELSYGSVAGEVDTYQGLASLQCGVSVPQQYFAVASQEGKVHEKLSHLPNIMGLAYASVSKINKEKTFFDKFIEQNHYPNEFSMHLCANKKGSEIIIGGRTDKVDFPDSSFTKITSKALYCVKAKELRVKGGESFGTFPGEGQSFQCPQGPQTFIDSGTTLNLVRNDMYNKLVNFMKKAELDAGLQSKFPEEFWNGRDHNIDAFDVKISDADLEKFPVLEISFEGLDGQHDVVVEIRPETYFKDVGEGERTFGFRPLQDDSEPVVLGQAFMESAITLFDRENSQIGMVSNDGYCQ